MGPLPCPWLSPSFLQRVHLEPPPGDPLPPSSFTSLPACAQPCPRHGERGDDQPRSILSTRHVEIPSQAHGQLHPRAPGHLVAPLPSSHCMSPYPDHSLRVTKDLCSPLKCELHHALPCLSNPRRHPAPDGRPGPVLASHLPLRPHRTTVTITSPQEERA